MAKIHKQLVVRLCFIALIMFGFTFALIPLYSVFCKVTGLNGKIDDRHPETYTRYKTQDSEAEKRKIMVEFDTNRNKSLPFEFSPEHSVLAVTPGELTLTSYHVKNLSTQSKTIQAIPSVSPGLAAKHLKKLECFCFDKQTLKPGESMKLPLRFWLEPELPTDIRRLTLSYTIFDVTKTR